MATKGRKKVTTKFTADVIDCTAPVSKILDELRLRNPQAFMFYSYLLRPRRTKRLQYVNNHCTIPGHPINAFDDDWDGELNLDYFEPFPYKSHPPIMITPLRNTNEADPVTSLLRKKKEWHHTVSTLKRTATHTRLMESYEELNDEVVECQRLLVQLAAHLDSEPAPHCDAPYNWLYAGGGSLRPACVGWLDCLLHSRFTTVYLSEFNRDTLAINMDHIASFDCGEGNNILETIFSPENILVLRTEHKIFILKLIKIDDKITLEKLKCIKSELPYTSVAFDSFHNNILYITTLDYKLSIVNLDRMRARNVQLKGKLTTLVNNWNTVVSSERGFYVHAGRTTVSIYDKSSNNVVHVWKDLRTVTDDKTCNDISVAEHFPGSQSLYFGTDHHLFLMDLRYTSKNGPKVVRRWTHGMESPPTYMSHCNFEFSKDLICLSSQWCEDMCVVSNYSDRLINDTDSGGVTMPYRPPSILNALSEAKQMLLCHNLYNPIEGRLVTAITGNLMFEHGEKYVILMQNSLGDISCHTLYPEHLDSFIDDDSAKRLHEWSETYELPKKDLEVSSIKNIADVWKSLKKVPEDYKIFTFLKKPKSKFSEKEIVETFEAEKVDSGLREVWCGVHEADAGEPSTLNLFYSDEE